MEPRRIGDQVPGAGRRLGREQDQAAGVGLRLELLQQLVRRAVIAVEQDDQRVRARPKLRRAIGDGAIVKLGDARAERSPRPRSAATTAQLSRRCQPREQSHTGMAQAIASNTAKRPWNGAKFGRMDDPWTKSSPGARCRRRDSSPAVQGSRRGVGVSSRSRPPPGALTHLISSSSWMACSVAISASSGESPLSSAAPPVGPGAGPAAGTAAARGPR